MDISRSTGRIALAGFSGAIVLGAALGGQASAAAKPATATLIMKDFDYRPATLTVRPGTKITVVNRDKAAHTVTGKGFDTGNVAGNKSKVVVAPKKRGTYPYVCTYHPNMEAVLKVK